MPGSPVDVPRSAAPRRRDAAGTRRLLLDAAGARFTRQGYAATPVRDIADDAGVNVSLINRYFGSKEGLFEACLGRAAEALGTAVDRLADLGGLAEAVGGQAAPKDTGTSHLLLLIRSSGDERTEALRIGILRDLTERLAAVAGWTPDHPDADALLLRAQLVLAAGTGVAVLRATGGLAPLCDSGKGELSAPMRDLVRALLG